MPKIAYSETGASRTESPSNASSNLGVRVSFDWSMLRPTAHAADPLSRGRRFRRPAAYHIEGVPHLSGRPMTRPADRPWDEPLFELIDSISRKLLGSADLRGAAL